jgi:NitT/TauT family transport system substrate-binding protein
VSAVVIVVVLLVVAGLGVLLYQQGATTTGTSTSSTSTSSAVVATSSTSSTTSSSSAAVSSLTTTTTTSTSTTTTSATTSRTTVQPTAVSMVLENTPQGRDAPLYYGLQQGYYKQNGVDLTINPSSTIQVGLTALEEGKVDFAVSDPSSLVLFAKNSNATDIRMISLNYEKNFAAIIYNNATISKPSDLNGKAGAMANPATSSLSAVWSLFAKANNLNTSSMNITFTSSGESGDLLLEGKVQFVVAIIDNLATYNEQGAASGLKFGAFIVADYGVELTGFSLVTTESMIQQHPAVVQAMVNATDESFVKGIENPQAAVTALVNANPQLNYTTSLIGFQETAGCCSVNVSSLTNPLQYGWMNPTDMQQTVANVAAAEGINGTLVATNYYTDAFVQEP